MVRLDDRGDLVAARRDQRPDIPSLAIEYLQDVLILTVRERCQAKGEQDSDV